MASTEFRITNFLLFLLFSSSAAGNDCCCSEPWKLERNTSESAFVGFTNGTYPGKYTSLLWHWHGVNTTGEWETTLWISHVTEKVLGSMAFRDSDGKISNSLTWRLDNHNLTWTSQGNKIIDVNWSVSVCNITKWKFETDITGNWIFKLGDVILEGPEGEKEIFSLLETDGPYNVTENSLGFDRQKREGENEHHTKPPGSGERAWNVVRQVLDRVFGSGENIINEGWVSHITNFFKIVATAVVTTVGGSPGSNDNGSIFITTPETPTEVETFNPNELPDIKDNDIKKGSLNTQIKTT